MILTGRLAGVAPQGCQLTVAGILLFFRRRNVRTVRSVGRDHLALGPEAGTQSAGRFSAPMG